MTPTRHVIWGMSVKNSHATLDGWRDVMKKLLIVGAALAAQEIQMKKLAAAIIVLAGTGPALAADLSTNAPATPPASIVPASGFFMGVGGSYNSVAFNNQNIFAQGISDIFQNNSPIASGSAGGSADPFFNTQSTFAPAAQAGYFQHFAGSNWLWGAKFSYSYLDATSTNQNVLIPQIGSFSGNNIAAFSGHVVVRSYEASIKNQMALVPFVGRSFEKSFVYFGVGPSLTQSQSNLNGVIGFADIQGPPTDITGAPVNFASSQWAYGVAGAVGVTYFFDRSWFLDLSYNYINTKTRTTNFSGPFASSARGYTDSGILSGYYSGIIISQSFTVSINAVF
jgi:opacity protein-like surface antigen